MTQGKRRNAMTTPRRKTKSSLVLAALLLYGGPAPAQDVSPQQWLQRMSDAVQSTNYEGTVIRLQNDMVEALKVVHVVRDGVVHEKVVTQEGNGLEIIRAGNEVQCILPDEQSVLVEEWNDQGALFSTLPTSGIRFGSEYDISIVREERVAGRRAVMLAIRPHDEYRFGHRLWLDMETGFPLQTKLLGNDGQPIEQVKFADIRIDQEISASALAPSISTENFRWFTQPQRTISHDVEAGWISDALPPGFRAVSTHTEKIAGEDVPVTHILYSDGLANVSVFIEPMSDKRIAERSRVGASNSYSTRHDGFQVTEIGRAHV